MRYAIGLAMMLTLAGCQERYRYPCQDPHNMNSPECTKQECEATRTCPEELKEKHDGR
jgi:hypothetical protein